MKGVNSGMLKNPFLITVFEALEDEINLVDFDKISRDYSIKTQKVNQIMKILESLPETVETRTGPVNVRKLINELEELQSDIFGICFDVAVQRGFSTAFKLIFHSLTIN